MAILTYEDVKRKPKTLQSMTSLTRDEFEALIPGFEQAWEEQQEAEGYDPSKGGRKPALQRSEERLFFVLFYLKTYPLQEVLAHLFGLSQGTANQWVHRLSTTLKRALSNAEQLPARLPEEMLERLAQEGAQDVALDGAGRRVNRPKDEEKQKRYYSGKKKRTR